MATVNQTPDYEVEAEETAEAADDGLSSTTTGSPAGGIVPGITNDSGGPYLNFACEVAVEWDQGLRTAPKAGSFGKKVAVWRVHGGQAFMVVRWVAQRLGTKPKPPHPNLLASNAVLLSKSIGNSAPPVGVGGDQLFSCSGTYRYVLQVAPGDADDLPAAAAASINVPPALNVMRISDFDRNLLHVVNPSSTDGGITAITS